MELNFVKPATYQICVKGSVPENWSDRLGGMVITQDRKAEHPVATLHGQLLDQAALLGVLNALYSLHLPLVSVDYIDKE